MTSQTNKFQIQIDKLVVDIQSIKIQQNCTYQVVETGLANLTQQLDILTKHGEAQKNIIRHLKAVVESNFNQINKQEDIIKHTENKMNKINDIMRAIAAVVDEKMNSIEMLRATVNNLQANCTPKPVSPLLLPEIDYSVPIETPRSMKDHHFQQMDHSSFFPATPELFGGSQ
jgi:chromosome segregation ATPase